MSQQTRVRRAACGVRGFSLIEALIAIVLVATVLPLALAAISHVTRGVGRAQHQAVAMRLAESRLAQWLADGSWQSAGASGDFSTVSDGEDAAGYHWQLRTAVWRTGSPVTDLQLTVSWDPAADSNAVTLETLVVANPQ